MNHLSSLYESYLRELSGLRMNVDMNVKSTFLSLLYVELVIVLAKVSLGPGKQALLDKMVNL